jgi:hypothetical protein
MEEMIEALPTIIKVVVLGNLTFAGFCTLMYILKYFEDKYFSGK